MQGQMEAGGSVFEDAPQIVENTDLTPSEKLKLLAEAVRRVLVKRELMLDVVGDVPKYEKARLAMNNAIYAMESTMHEIGENP